MHKIRHPFLRFFTDAASTGSDSGGETPPATPSLADLEAERDKWRALSRQNEERAKANAEKAKAFDELQEQSKSELQKALDAQAAAEKRAATAEAAALRASVAAKHAVPAEFLSGSTEEELEEAAQAILKWRGESSPTVKPKGTPSDVAGERGSDIEGAQQLTQEDLKGMSPADIVKARAEGQLNHLMGLTG